ncbi:MAG: alpha/beta fold hydrolase, partial [Acidimicrobiales bacterium]
MVAPRTFRLPDGRTLAFDDVGDPEGTPALYLHGTPDSRLARPPDAATAASGVRLLAVDRPGAGHSDANSGADLRAVGHDLAALLDHVGLDRVLLIGWSAGGLDALAAATVLGDRVRGVGLVGSVPPVEAYDDAEVVAALGPGRRAFVELAREVVRTICEGGLVDFVDLDVGLEPQQFHFGMPTQFSPPQYYRPWVEKVRSAAGSVPVMSVLGRITSMADAEAALAAGVCDIVGAARQLIAEPEFVRNARLGQEERSRACVACNWCLAASRDNAQGCTINPASYRERLWGVASYSPSDNP